MAESALTRYPLFALLPPATLQTRAAAGREYVYPTGETIFQEGTPGDWIYLLLEGRVRVVRTTSSGREVSLATLTAGEVFGEYALVPPGRNTATCRAAAPTRVLRLPLAPLRQDLAALPEVRARLKDWLRLNALLHHLRERTAFGFQSAPSALKFLDALQPVRVAPLRAIQADGLADDSWFYLQSGTACLEQADGTARELSGGDCFGERALLGQGGLRPVVALEEVHCLALPRDAFRCQEGSGSLGLQTCQVVAARGDLPWVGQREEADCGPATLAMIARHHGLAVTLDELRGRVQLEERGLSLMGLQHLAAAAGLECQAVRIDEGQWADVHLPAVAHLSNGHYVVVYQYLPSRVVLGDPAAGIVPVSRLHFLQQASGRLLVFRHGTA